MPQHDSNSSRFSFFVQTAPGLEAIAAAELKALGLKPRKEPGGVLFRGEADKLYAANLWLRTASRIVVRMGRFHASSFYELERRAKMLPWAEFLPRSGSVAVRVTCRKSRLYHSDAVAERVLAAIARAAPAGIDVRDDSHSTQSEQEDADDSAVTESMPEASAQLFVVRIVGDECEVSADSSGELLHRRGYRQETGKAPLRETLAAAMILACRWTSSELLLDPLCGSCTIPIEAALIARNIPPGIHRKFQFMQWPSFDAANWNGVVEHARRSSRELPSEIRGSDRDSGAVAAAERNAERAGVAGCIRYSVESLSSAVSRVPDERRGWVLANPPYGVRIGESRELRDLYASLGNAVRAHRALKIGILTADNVLARQVAGRLRERFKTRNGGIPVTFFMSAVMSTREQTESGAGV